MAELDAYRASPRARLGVGAAIVLVLAVAAVAIGVAVWRGAAAPVERITEAPDGPTPAVSVAAGELYVHVFGAVHAPGLYVLPAHARVVDAIAAAGGATDEAAVEGVNLARPLSDGEQLAVPTREELAVPPPGGGGPATEPGAPGASGGGKVNLNTADAAALDTLPRIGPAIAERIIAWRDENGPFVSVDDLLAVEGIGEKTLAALRDLVTV
ncbi:ComEA family DNA-binding protein [Microbacterium sp. Marseille-Q6965]|uniref:ComEA family DNA-binding protein n=1 Tax=Microbacterium sp. Marseille-Q6965 TaxID=2965072 RepID=UPI0021B761CF|nr:ComEA family DNA-binding protein [Microbacterium sp. Marseille-Q6965]